DFQRELHTAGGTELVDEELRTGIALEVLEQQSFPSDRSLLVFACNSTFRNPIGNFRNFQNWVRFGADALEFSGAVERLDPVPQIVVGQDSSPDDKRLYDGRSGTGPHAGSTLPHFGLCD